MNKTKIEWCDYTWNPIRGYCPNDCPYCYAHRMYNRFGWDKTIRLDEKEIEAPAKLKKPSRIFVGSMIEMYHSKIPPRFVLKVIEASILAPHHTYITLAKFPERMGGLYDLPKNWWTGVTVEGEHSMSRLYYLKHTVGHIEFVSFEPLLSPIMWGYLPGILHSLSWIIIGGLTPKPAHKKEWIDDIVQCADKLGIPVFIKDNAHYPIKRQEFPKEKK